MTTNMETVQTSWDSDTSFNIRVPVTKVNKSARTVSGFATVDSVDEHDDIITAACASNAFSKFRGNLREMHQPVAVGKVVGFEQHPVYDAKTDKLYNGIYVTAYISKGAPDTWEKVADGTLGGFSIGGNLVDSESYYDEGLGKSIRIIKEMDLYELSLVDNPANQLANVVSIQKLNGESVAKGIAAETKTETVFWCEADSVALLSEGSPECVKCGGPMKDIGWIESTDEPLIKLKDVVNDYVVSKTSVDEGGVNMSEQKNEEVEKASDATQEESVVAEPVVEVEKSVETEESADVTDVEKSADETPAIDLEAIADVIKTAVTAALEPLAKAIDEVLGVTKSYSEASKESAGAIEEVKASIDKSIAEIGTKVSEVSTVVDEIAAGTAVKKSGELGRESDIQKSLWSGTFLSAETL